MRRKKRVGANRMKQIAARKSSRKKKINSGRIIRSVAIAAALIISAGVLVTGGGRLAKHAKSSRFLEIRDVVIKGNQYVKKTDVRQASLVNFPFSLFSVDKKEISKRISEIAWVRDVKVRRRLDRKLEILVSEKKPFAWVCDDSLYLADESGVLLRPIPGVMFELPLITGIKKDSTNRIKDVRRWKTAVSVLTLIRERDERLFKLISEVNVKKEKINVYTITGTRIVLPTERTEDRIVKLATLLDHFRKSGKTAGEINLQYERVAYVR